MVWTDKVRNLKFIFIGVAIIIVATSLFVSHRLVEDLKNEERTRMEVWAAAMRSLTEAEENTDLNLVLTVINGNNSIPVIVTDEENKILSHRNLGIQSRSSQDSLKQLQGRLTEMRQTGKQMKMPLEITSQEDNTTTQSSPDQLHHINIYYEESLILHRLALFPYVQLAVVSLFLLVALVALLSTKKAEQNRVWVGLTKETAHQLGTPISSLMAWIEVLKETYPNDDLLEDMQTDVQRLERITERFSKIGSQPALVNTSICPIIAQTVSYLQRRISSRITISGQIKDDRYIIDVTDTGKGIARKNFSSVFKAGYTTKQRGWGLGLSLSKRIIEKYHHGRIYVFQSIVGKGTTFRIELPLVS